MKCLVCSGDIGEYERVMEMGDGVQVHVVCYARETD